MKKDWIIIISVNQRKQLWLFSIIMKKMLLMLVIFISYNINDWRIFDWVSTRKFLIIKRKKRNSSIKEIC